MKTAINQSYDFNGITRIELTNGHNINFSTERLIEFITVNELNVTCENYGKGNICDPNSCDLYKDVTVKAEQYLDDNWSDVVAKYHEQVIIKGQLV